MHVIYRKILIPVFLKGEVDFPWEKPECLGTDENDLLGATKEFPIRRILNPNCHG